ncbi:hypothetical protein AR446_02045 [Campylobacter coli]|uniref:hypothetical protein n=1 Tax=Campylobacter coli TaxID=195 RepID=UPI0006ED126E|nr:hypothetical protein [Campylobacter coli]ALL31413.1 hypothetical protein AR446_02045 [Campylobacter coli]
MKKMSLGDDFWDQLKVIEKNSPKSFLIELISQIKDYANIADASYAMLDLKNKENNHARI